MMFELNKSTTFSLGEDPEDSKINMWRIHRSSVVPAPYWWESERQQEKWIQIIDNAINQAEGDPAYLCQPREILYRDGSMDSFFGDDACIRMRPEQNEPNEGCILRPGDMFASDPVHWVMYVGEGNFVHMNNRAPRLLALLDFVLNGATPAWVMVQSIQEKKRAAVFRKIPGIKACPTNQERLERLRRARKSLGPVSWHLRFCNCQHLATYIGTGTFPTETPQSAAVPWMLKVASGLALLPVLRRGPHLARSVFMFSVGHDHRTHPLAVRARAKREAAEAMGGVTSEMRPSVGQGTAGRGSATGGCLWDGVRTGASTALTRLRGTGRNLREELREWSARLGPFAGLSAALTAVMLPDYARGPPPPAAAAAPLRQCSESVARPSTTGGTRGGTGSGAGGVEQLQFGDTPPPPDGHSSRGNGGAVASSVRDRMKMSADAACRRARLEFDEVCDPIRARARTAVQELRDGLATGRIREARRAAARMLGVCQPAEDENASTFAPLGYIYQGIQTLAMWAVPAQQRAAPGPRSD